MNFRNQLPDILPIFPLSNFIFFPKTSVPLNIFEPRYIEMINDSLNKDRVIGMIQPKIINKRLFKDNPALYSVGCAGKITSFNETEDNRILLILNGISRFKILEEVPSNKLYRQCKVGFEHFKEDLYPKKNNIAISDLNLIIKDFKIFFQKKGYELDWQELEKQKLDQVLNSLCMVAPFSLEEKQILLETKNIKERKIKLKEILNTYLLSDIDLKTIQ